MEGFAATFAERGYLAIDRLFDVALIDAIRAEYGRQLGGSTLHDLPPHLKVGDRRVQVPIELKGPLLDPRLTANPLLLRMIEAIVGKEPVIDSFTCVTAFPGAKDQRLHRDHNSLFDDGAGKGLPCFALTVAVPLIDLDEETGSTRIYPGTHLREFEEAVRTEGEVGYPKRGGCYFMDYRLQHQGTANNSADPRPILYIIYARPWFMDIQNFAQHARIRLSEADARAMPQAQRRLFRRLAVKGNWDLTETELLAG